MKIGKKGWLMNFVAKKVLEHKIDKEGSAPERLGLFIERIGWERFRKEIAE